MLRDTVTYGGEIILTIYHENPELDVKSRHWIEKEKIGRFNAVFEETSVETSIEEIISGRDIEEALISYNDSMSLNKSSKITTIMKRIRNTEKPSAVFRKETMDIKLSEDNWLELCRFVKEYTGMDILQHAIACGDIFVFQYCWLDYKREKEDGILVKQNGYDRIDVYFKACSRICDYVSIAGKDSQKEELLFKSGSDWDSFDIYAFCDGRLMFRAPDVVFMETMELRQGCGCKRKNTLNNNYNVQYSDNQQYETITIGKPKDSIRRKQDLKEREIYRQFCHANAQSKSHPPVPDRQKAFFISVGQEDIVYKAVNVILDKKWDEIIFHDPYFFDSKYSKSMKVVDWVRLICCGNLRHAVIAFSKEKKDEKAFDKLKRLITNDWIILQQLNRGVELKFIEMDTYVHDRFLLCRNSSQYGGLCFGASVNSLDNNYFFMFKLESSFAEVCWKKIHDIMEEKSIKD